MQTLSSADPIRAHRRALWLKIILPVVLPSLLVLIVVIALGVGVAIGDLESSQVTTVMGIVATAFIALPMMLLCLIPFALFAVLAWLGGKGYAHAQLPLRFARRLTGQIAIKTDQIAPKLTKPLVGLNIGVTRLEHMIRGWQQTQPLPTTKDRNDD